MKEQEQKWIETNNQVCALLRQAHDVLALSSLPPKRTWVGLTMEEMQEILNDPRFQMKPLIVHAVEAKLKEKNT